MAGRRLPAVPESIDLDHYSTEAAHPPCNSYRDLIRSVSVSGGLIRSPLFFQSGSTTGSSYSHSGSSSDPSNNSGFSSGSASAAAAAAGIRALCDLELREIARRMVTDGYTRCIVQAFSDGPDDDLERWFFDLDVDWVLPDRDDHRDKSTSSFQDSVERWIRALTVIVLSMRELQLTALDEPTPASARFGRACINKMLVFVDAIVAAPDAGRAPALGEKLWAVLNMYVCVSDASSFKWSRRPVSHGTQCLIDEINGSLSGEEIRLNEAIFSTMEAVKRLMEKDGSWAIEIPRGGGEVHQNTRFLVDCIVLVRSAVLNYHFENLRALADATVDYLKDLLWRKSELCKDPILRYIFLLNNSYFVTQQLESSKLVSWVRNHWDFPVESRRYIDGYFQVSWAHVLSCISKSSPGPLRCPNNGSSLAKFESAFHRTYEVQRFWKVPSPQLRRMLRKTIIERVISGYREYLEEHPELEKHIIFGNSTPDDLEEMLGGLFEG